VSSRLSAEGLAQALQAKATGTGKWQALCPAHEDSKPSLSITTGRSGFVVFICRAGCTQDQVIEALRARGLWSRSRDPRPAGRATSVAAPEPQRRDARTLIREFNRLLDQVQLIDEDAPYIVIGELLEGAAAISYHCVARAAVELYARSETHSRHVARWMLERYPDAVFDN
jgi:hypothetical protein